MKQDYYIIKEMIINYYKTKKVIRISDSCDDFFHTGIYDVYRNDIGTMGVFDDKDRFTSVLSLKNIGVDWEYVDWEYI